VSGQGSSLVDYALGFSLDADLPRIFAAQPPYGESSWRFMTPPDPTFREFVANGGKMIVFHGAADPVFSVLDTLDWYEQFKAAHGALAQDRARMYIVPGMNHSRGGVATDQVDLLDPLIDWVEQGRAPQAVVARARGAGSAVPNPEVPAAWRADRSRPLCPYPLVARYAGRGDIEEASSFRCEK
jgi:feruloyl esterase